MCREPLAALESIAIMLARFFINVLDIECKKNHDTILATVQILAQMYVLVFRSKGA